MINVKPTVCIGIEEIYFQTGYPVDPVIKYKPLSYIECQGVFHLPFLFFRFFGIITGYCKFNLAIEIIQTNDD